MESIILVLVLKKAYFKPNTAILAADSIGIVVAVGHWRLPQGKSNPRQGVTAVKRTVSN
jgi:hypothetical protein